MDEFDWLEESFGYEEEAWSYEDRNYMNLYHSDEEDKDPTQYGDLDYPATPWGGSCI